MIIDGEQKLQLQNRQGKNYSDNTTPNWDGVAVEGNDSEGYEFLLQGQNARSGQAYIWTTNSEGVITRGSGWKSGDTLLSWEGKFNIDRTYAVPLYMVLKIIVFKILPLYIVPLRKS